MFIFLRHLDLLSVGIVIAAIAILGFVAIFSDSKSITNRTFFCFCLLTIFWGSLNYLSYQINIPDLAFWLLRLGIFTAVWHAFFLFQLLYVFPKREFAFPAYYENFLIPLVFLAAFLNLTPFTFSHISALSSSNQIIKVANGPGIILFSVVIFALIIGGIFVFIKKIRSGKDLNPDQVKIMATGIVLTFGLILIFNFILPAFFNNSHFINFGALFIFPFIVGTGYSIFRHGVLNIKIISTEILTFILSLVILLEVITTTDPIYLIFRVLIFLLVVVVGVLLIKSVINEVRQREQLQILTSELAAANEKLKTLDQARAEFISIASHQLRTPPATIKWYLSAVLSGDYGKLPEEIGGVLKKTEQTNNHLISLIEDMLNVSRIERGKMEFLFEPANVEELARFAYEQLLPIAHDKKLSLTYDPPAQPLPLVTVDREKLKQVMNNLIDNALKYTKAGTVNVKIFRDGENVRFEVRDTGKGISKADSASIFQKYTRGKESIKQSAGLGLGLYVAKIIIEQHKGRIWAESLGEGKGSVFLFTLPIQSNLQPTSIDFAKAS